MIKNFHGAFLANDHIPFFDEDCGDVTFFSDEMGILSVNLNNIDLDDVNFDKDDPETYYSCETSDLA